MDAFESFVKETGDEDLIKQLDMFKDMAKPKEGVEPKEQLELFRTKLLVNNIIGNAVAVFTHCCYFIRNTLLDLQVKLIHQASDFVTANIKAFFAQFFHQLA